ncbi:MAG: hypothetical protein ACPHJ3_12800 [Rubripirellula sp.]
MFHFTSVMLLLHQCVVIREKSRERREKSNALAMQIAKAHLL